MTRQMTFLHSLQGLLLAVVVGCASLLQLVTAVAPNQYSCGPLGSGISDPGALYGSTVQVNVVTADGSNIYLGGRFGSVNGTTVTGFAKIISSGTATISAGTLTGVGSNPPEIRAFSGGGGASMMIGGSFATGTPAGGGTAVTMNNVGFYSFSGGTFSAQDSGCNGPINAVLPANGGPWIIAGSFTSCGSGYGPNIVYLQVRTRWCGPYGCLRCLSVAKLWQPLLSLPRLPSRLLSSPSLNSCTVALPSSLRLPCSFPVGLRLAQSCRQG